MQPDDSVHYAPLLDLSLSAKPRICRQDIEADVFCFLMSGFWDLGEKVQLIQRMECVSLVPRQTSNRGFSQSLFISLLPPP